MYPHVNNPNQHQVVIMATPVQQNPQMVQAVQPIQQSPQYVQPMYPAQAVDAKQVPASLPPVAQVQPVQQGNVPTYKLPFPQAVQSYRNDSPGVFSMLLTTLIIGFLAAVIHLALFQDRVAFKIFLDVDGYYYYYYYYYYYAQGEVANPSAVMGDSVLQKLPQNFQNVRQEGSVLEGEYIVEDTAFYIVPAAGIIIWQAIFNIMQMGNKFDMCYLVSNIIRAITLLIGIFVLVGTLTVVQEDIDILVEEIGDEFIASTEIEAGPYVASIIMAAVAMIISIVQASQYCCCRVNNNKPNCTCA
eukprot:snap_masked-scaffold_7-processed-gene-19.48-mRNA-1 protein AED:1.00 eAED:1.00 QI:0/-1/0/0/-1/1/1/0/300